MGYKNFNVGELLKAETITLLFNLGKTSSKVLSREDVYQNYYEKKHFVSDLKYVRGDIKQFESWKNVKFDFDDSIDFFRLFAEKKPEKWYKLFQACESINSSIDKGVLGEDQLYQHPWISNAFGAFREEVSKRNLDEKRHAFFVVLLDQLKEIKLKEVKLKNEEERDNIWKEFRRKILQELKAWYSHLLSDTRYPANDVTLWDQVYMTASLFKAALAGISITNRMPNNPRGEVRWSVLGVQYDKLHLAEKALRVHYIRSYRELVGQVDEKVKCLIEEDYAIGNEMFRDETGIYFVVSEHLIDKTSEEDKLYHLHPDFKKLREDIVNTFNQVFQGEVYPSIRLSAPSRTTLNISELVRQAKRNFTRPMLLPKNINQVKNVHEIKNISSNSGLCRICKFRIATESDGDLKICSECKDRRSKRVDIWLEQLGIADHETIWTGELQDRYGRLALVTLKFELEEWLNGNLLNTVYMVLPKNKWEDVERDFVCEILNGANKKIKDTKVAEYFDKALQGQNFHQTISSIIIERTVGEAWEELLSSNFPNMVNYNERNVDWSDFHGLLDKEKCLLVRVLMQLLFRRDPSPARLRRIWETTKAFFLQLEFDLVRLLGIPEWRKQRLYWELDPKFVHSIDGLYSYADQLDFWVTDGKAYLITSIEQAAKVLGTAPAQVALRLVEERRTEWLKDKIRIKEVDGKSEILLEKRAARYTQPYKPYFSIMDPTPVSWQFVIPAEYVPNLIEQIRKTYLKNFRYVYGKLPLHIGIVTQNYKRPLYAGIQALRRIRRELDNWDNIKTSAKLDEILKKITEKMIYGKDPAEYFSYYECVSNDQNNWDGYYVVLPNGHVGQIAGPKVDNLNTSVWVYPCTFDFEFLDVNTRRNEIRYVSARRDVDHKRYRPYNLEDWIHFVKFRDYFFHEESSRRRLQLLIEMIYHLRQDWKQDVDSAQRLLLTAIVDFLELEEKPLNGQSSADHQSKSQRINRNQFAQLLGFDNWTEFSSLQPEKFMSAMDRLIDMFVFWHQIVKVD